MYICEWRGEEGGVREGQKKKKNIEEDTLTRSENGVFKKLPEACKVSFPGHIRQVWHHVGDHFIAAVLCELKTARHCSYSVSPIRISRYILVYGLDPYLYTGTSIPKH